jgi:hypothetical protein
MIRILFILFVLGLCIYISTSNSYESTSNSSNTYISTSKVNGEGLFTDQNFKKGDIILDNIFPHKDSNEILFKPINDEFFYKYISKEGVKINHCSNSDNAVVYTSDHKIYKLVSTKDILKNTEITVNYDKTHKKYPFIDGSHTNYNLC